VLGPAVLQVYSETCEIRTPLIGTAATNVPISQVSSFQGINISEKYFGTKKAKNKSKSKPLYSSQKSNLIGSRKKRTLTVVKSCRSL
jgi:hypothetical protein